MKKRILLLITAFLFLLLCPVRIQAEDTSLPRENTPNYRVSYYSFDCFNMQDENGRKYGYGYDMLQQVTRYLQCTFTYVGFDKSTKECEEMLRNGEIDLYTAARKTEEREKEFIFSTHPAITATTCMNIKRGNTSVIAGDYSTYNGLRIGLLERHTYNNRFLEFTKEKGFNCTIVYYKTPTELSKALIDGEVDALVNSYIRTPEDEMTIEDFGETPYYFMARKENRDLIDGIDSAIDQMNIETPNWRSDLFNEYYGEQNANTELTKEEAQYLQKLQEQNTTITAITSPDQNPYSWYENETANGIVCDLFVETARKLKLKYKILPASSDEEYKDFLSEGKADIWMDASSYYEDEEENRYKLSDSYLTTTVSILRKRGSSGKIQKIGICSTNLAMKEIITSTWPQATIIPLITEHDCISKILNNEIDGALFMSYSAQKLASDDVQNRFSVDIVPGSSINLKMGVSSEASHLFYNIWNKTLTEVAQNRSAELVQAYLEKTESVNLLGFLFDHPIYLICISVFLSFTVLMIVLYMQSVRSQNRQLRISEQLSAALDEAKEAEEVKLNFFSKMSHDLRTPLNVVLGMTQIAQKYKDNPEKLQDALNNISSEGNYLLTMINSILDVNQLEHGHIELIQKPFSPHESMMECIQILKPLADRKNQSLTVTCNCSEDVVTGDSSHYSQIMVNIISNAIKYTDRNGEIHVSLNRGEDGHYLFTCQDNGIGMESEFIRHICEDYTRAEDSRTSATEGTGLGMAVVKGFTELMHGSLNIESTPGKGSVFTVTIPFGKASEKEQNIVLEQMKHVSHVQADFHGMRVLLAEDNALNAEIAIELMQTVSLKVDRVENGKECVQKFSDSACGTYVAIFMDMQMPIMDGIEATKRIRSLHRKDNRIPVFAMTANTFARDREMCEKAGMNGYISKPINMRDIVRTLKAYVQL